MLRRRECRSSPRGSAARFFARQEDAAPASVLPGEPAPARRQPLLPDRKTLLLYHCTIPAFRLQAILFRTAARRAARYGAAGGAPQKEKQAKTQSPAGFLFRSVFQKCRRRRANTRAALFMRFAIPPAAAPKRRQLPSRASPFLRLAPNPSALRCPPDRRCSELASRPRPPCARPRTGAAWWRCRPR